MLSAPQLKICSEIASNEKGGSVEVARKMLNFALQICQVHRYIGKLLNDDTQLSIQNPV